MSVTSACYLVPNHGAIKATGSGGGTGFETGTGTAATGTGGESGTGAAATGGVGDPTLTLGYSETKVFEFSWVEEAGVSYTLLEKVNCDGPW